MPAPLAVPELLVPRITGPAPLAVPELLVPAAPGAPGGRRRRRIGTGADDGLLRRVPLPHGRASVLAGIAAVVLLVGTVLVAVIAPGPTARHGTAFAAPEPTTAIGNAPAAAHPSANLPVATTAPAPAPPALLTAAPLQPHEVFGYAPYWTLPQSSGFDVKDMTTLAYFSVDANADGTLDQSGPGWNGYQSQDLVDLVSRAHAAGARVVLTVTCFDQHALDQITSDPNAPARLSAALVAAVEAKHLDGVNFDFEGLGSADQVGLTNLVATVSAALHAADPHWQVSMAVYASAAGDPGGFYDIGALAPSVDAFFVMAYDMNSRSQPGPTSPLSGPGFTDTTALEEFVKVVPPSKVILGLPYYGYDWPTTDGSPTATATGPESPLPDSTIAASGHPTYWDSATSTPWTSYQVGSQWHTTYFDDPTSLALKAQLANFFHIAGVGIWALGMDGNSPAMLSALLGNSPAVKDVPSGPPVPGTGFTTVASYAGTAGIALTPIGALPPGVTPSPAGVLTGLTTSDPALACLQTGPPLTVWSYPSLPGILVAEASTPIDCVPALWAFPTPPTTAPGTTTTTTPGTTTTTTTTTTAPVTSTTAPVAPSSTTTTTSTTAPTGSSSTTTTTTGPSTRG